MSPLPTAGDRVAELRDAFDSAFSEAPRTDRDTFEDMLAIRVGPDPYALRLAEISGLIADKAVTNLPGAPRALLGIAGFRGAVVPVFDLRNLLGYEDGGTRRWLVLTASESTVALAFDQFEGHVRVPCDAIATDDDAEIPGTGARELVRVAEIVRPIIRIPSLLDDIKDRVAEGVLRRS